MQQDFHYYCVAVLARAAGFNSRDALILAFASQYVDDSTEGELIPLIAGDSRLKFEPVRTAYGGLEMTRSTDWSSQKRVWIPYHFLPQQPFQPYHSQQFSFTTSRNSPFAQWLIDEAAGEPLANHKRRLCRIGIALHTFADSWSHEGFSGRQNRMENDVENIHIRRQTENTWKHLSIENVVFDLMPQIGHAEAGCLPDLSYLHWKYSPGRPGNEEIERDNVAHFMEASRVIYKRLRAMEKTDPEPVISWKGLESGLRQLLATQPMVEPRLVDRLTLRAYQSHQAADVESRCELWKKKFGHLFRPHSATFPYHYDRHAWRNQALEGDTDWDDYTQKQWQQMPPRKTQVGFWDSLWVHFHRAALHQRHLVLENLP
jgi:hypothetical protein